MSEMDNEAAATYEEEPAQILNTRNSNKTLPEQPAPKHEPTMEDGEELLPDDRINETLPEQPAPKHEPTMKDGEELLPDDRINETLSEQPAPKHEPTMIDGEELLPDDRINETLPEQPAPKQEPTMEDGEELLPDDRIIKGIDISTGEYIYSTKTCQKCHEDVQERIISAAFAEENECFPCNLKRKTTNEGNEAVIESKDEDSGACFDNEGQRNEQKFGHSPLAKMRKERGIRKFRAVVNFIRIYLYWTRDLNNEQKANSYNIADRHGVPLETVTFNVNDYKRKRKTFDGLRAMCKKILQLPSEERTPEDLRIVMNNVIQRLEYFDTYSESIQQQLARVVQYDCFEKGRKIIQQGHRGLSYYFIVKGAVTVYATEVDKKGISSTRTICELGIGTSFGVMALILDIKRPNTIICTENLECLRLDKDEFNAALRAELEQEFQSKKQAIWGHIPAFKHIPESCLVNINYLWHDYPPETIVRSNTKDPSTHLEYIESGQMKVVREITVWRETLSRGEERVVLKPRDQAAVARIELRQQKDLIIKCCEERHLLTVRVLNKGDYFGAGEDLTNTHLITVGPVVVIKVPRFLSNQHGLKDLMIKLRKEFNESLPSDREVFDTYTLNKEWHQYKKTVTSNVVQWRCNSRKHATLNDVPYNTKRAQQPFNI